MKKFLIILLSLIVVSVASFMIMMKAGHEDVSRGIFPLLKNSAANWEDVFAKPGSISISTFITGELDVKYSGLINTDHEKAAAREEDIVQVPVLAHLIRHQKYGDYLVDAGLDSKFQTEPYGNITGILTKIFGAVGRQKKEQNIASILEKGNISLKGIFITHLHPDHMAGIFDLPENLKYIAGKGETYPNYKYFHYCNYFKDSAEVLEIDFSKTDEMPILGKSVDIFGDSSLWAILSPGHTEGFIAYLVNSKQGPALIVSDACSLREGFEKGIGPGTYSGDIEEAQKTLEKFIAFKEKYPNVKILYGHDR